MRRTVKQKRSRYRRPPSRPFEELEEGDERDDPINGPGQEEQK